MAYSILLPTEYLFLCHLTLQSHSWIPEIAMKLTNGYWSKWAEKGEVIYREEPQALTCHFQFLIEKFGWHSPKL